MKRQLILAALCCAAAGATVAQVNSPDAGGYLERGILMFDDRNYEGCIDQLARIHSLSPTPEQAERALYYLGLASQGLGDDEALALFRKFLADYPVSPLRADVMMSVGDYWFNRGNYAEALQEYAQVNPLALTGNRCDDMSYRTAYSYMMLGEYATAASQFRTLQSSEEYGNVARFYLGYIAYVNKDYTLALQYFRNVDTSREPGNAAPYYEAQIAFAQGDFNRSLDISRRLLASGSVPAFTAECNRLAGESLYNLGDESEALPYLWKYCAEASDPQPSAFYILGVSEYRRGDYDAAIKLLQQSIGTHSAMEQSAYLFLGQAYLKRGDNNSALMAFENAYRVDYDREVRETAFYNYAVARMDGGRVPFGNSVALLENFLQEYPNSTYSADVQRYIVNGYMSDNDYESALAALDKIQNPSAELIQAKQRVLLVLGSREYTSGKISQAISHLTQARRLASDNPSIRRQCDLWLGDCYYTRGNYDEAASSYRSFIASAPKSDTRNRAIAYYDLGYTRFCQERYSDALTDFRDAVTVMQSAPADISRSLLADCYNRIADCHYYQTDFTSAAEAYNKAYDLNPSSGDYALYQLAIMKGLRKDHAGKIESIDALSERFPSSGLIPNALLEKAESQSALDQTDQAIATYRHLVQQYPNTAPGRNGYLQLAITYINRGERSQGIETYKKVIYTFPSSEEARIAADDLKQLYAADGRLQDFVAFINSVPNAPRYEASELEKLAFQAAENDYVNSGATSKLSAYIAEYPQGADRAQALYYLADAAWNEGKPAEAQGYAMQVIQTHPDSEVAEDAMLIKAAAESSLGKTEIAYSTYQQLESRASGSNMLREARIGLMRTAADLGKYAEVVNTADKLLASTAANSPADLNEIRFMRGMANNSLGNYDKAYEDWSELAENPADIFGAKSAYYMGNSQLDRGLVKGAKSTAEKLIDSDTPHQYWLARGFILYSDILRKEGKKFEADEYLKSLKSNYPGTEADIFQMIDSRL
ncbi:tetratricopeptide repeat protein [Duncaniella muris]|jgi:TolA-binding protein|uniref:tetratricopeptide repeat protein n=1 Tax=Duncaniella muris TaxID=2094150 RepID=UPI0025A548DA|nr:tetratricopeptide repeat protein [Duncaniella muris]